jgi:proline iminopeptidase
MALEYAKRYPERVSHVVMIAIAPDLGPRNMEAAQRYWSESVSSERKAILEEKRRRLPDEKLAQLPFGEGFIKRYVREAPTTWFDPRFDSPSLWEGVEQNEVFAHIWLRVFPKIDVTKGLEALDRPVFLALGRYDFLVASPSSWDPIRPHFKALTVRVFERSGHTPQLEEPEPFDRELPWWLQRTASGARRI